MCSSRSATNRADERTAFGLLRELFADNRSNGKWLEVFNDAGLKLVKEEVQVGMPEELFVVKT